MYCDDQPLGGVGAAEEETRDLIEGVDEDGNNVLLEVVRYFFYNGEEYVVLGVAHDGECDCECEHCDHHEEEEAVNLYIMKVVESEEDGEDAVPTEQMPVPAPVPLESYMTVRGGRHGRWVCLGALAALAAVGCVLWQLDWLPF